ncbi:MAG TPA: serine protease [Microthrixaceae bacterium]|nr:serine protease [Microthrixaceae bacterium]
MAGIVVVGLVLGVLIATWWSITPVSRAPSPRVAANAGSTQSPDGWTDRGWAVVDDEPWRAAVVRITTDRCGVEIRGSGVIVDGIVLTNRHVIDGAASVLLTTADGTTHPVRSIGVSSDVDLARLAAGGLPRGLSLAEEPSALGDGYVLAGFPAGHEFSSRAAAIAEVDRGWGFPDPERRLRLDRPVVPGESGSAVIDRRGDVAALVYARANDDGHGLAIDAQELDEANRQTDNQSFIDC